jgi:TRAP-type uncharacterized transport system substrate-binding protein
MLWLARIGKRVRDGLLPVAGVAALCLAAYFALHKPPEHLIRLRMTAGQKGGARELLAHVLRREAARRALAVKVEAVAGSVEALHSLESGEVDAALIQGGLEMVDFPSVRQVLGLHIEPLHLLVKERRHSAVSQNLAELRGSVVNLGDPRSGTYALSKEIMAFAGLEAQKDYTMATQSYLDLERESQESRLPDAVFTVSTLPSPLARHLIRKHGYRLVALPFREAFALEVLDSDHASTAAPNTVSSGIDRRYLYDVTIPAFTYQTEPRVPAEPVPTLGTRLLLVARHDLPSASVSRLLEVVLNSPFAKTLHPTLDARQLESPPELPWHAGTREFVRRRSPLITGDIIDLVEKEVSILGVVAGGLFFLGQWLRRLYRRRRERGFESYILRVAKVESDALELSRAPTLDLAALLGLQDDLTRIKAEALNRFARGELEGEELMSGFLVHASDVRDFVARMILHERDNLEARALAQRRPAEAVWNEELGVQTRSEPDEVELGKRANSHVSNEVVRLTTDDGPLPDTGRVASASLLELAPEPTCADSDPARPSS